MEKFNIFKPHTKRYYRDVLENISDMCIDYDGFVTTKGLKSLIDDIKDLARTALKGKTIYVRQK